MNSFPLPALTAAFAALVALPFNAPAAGTLLFTAALGTILHADYVQRHRRVSLPRRAVRPAPVAALPVALCRETNCLAA